MKFDRIHVIVMDSVGIGQAPDAEAFGDVGSHTLGNISRTVSLSLPEMTRLGLGYLADISGVPPVTPFSGYVKKLQEVSAGKDTMTGHWELMGLRMDTPFRVFPDGFPEELLDKIRTFSGRDIVCNKPYSGTEVINDYGAHQMETGDLIIYTSADPVLQIAAHEDIIPLEELYEICEYTRSITLEDPYMIGRIIARPYIGTPGHFQRTSNRHDYALNPFGKTVLDHVSEAGYDVIAIGKIHDIFNGQGITDFVRTKSNMDGVDQLLHVMKRSFTGMSFTNLVDFDAVYGHRRDPKGYAEALEAFDARIPELMDALAPRDLLMITADHGNDPTFSGTDHTREYVPLMMYSPSFEAFGVLDDGYFADIAATIADNFKVPVTEHGTSFLNQLI